MVNNEGQPLRDSLTEREMEILARLSTGLTDQQIAADLFLSHNTVRWYNRQIYSKLGVSNRTQAIIQARALGLLMPEPAQTPPRTVSRRLAEQRVHFTHSFDGTRIAYALSGNGPPLVKTGTFMSHLEYD